MKNRIPRKLKKKYKKMGIWDAYVEVGRDDPAFINNFISFEYGGFMWHCKPFPEFDGTRGSLSELDLPK